MAQLYYSEGEGGCMKKMIGCCLILLLFSWTAVFGYFYQVAVAADEQQLVICLGDYHLKCHPANKAQRLYIEALLQKCVGKKVKFIVEDLSSVNNDGRMVCCNFGMSCSEGVLGQLANKARALGIAVDNVEYRYCRVAGIGPLLNNLKVHPHDVRSSATIVLGALYKEVLDEIEKIRKYNDGKVLNSFYKRAIAAVHTALLKTGFNNKITVAQYCAQLLQKQYRQELEKLCIFDSALIDMNIMHSIATSDAAIVFVCAGGSHVEQVHSMLQKVGHKSLLKTSVITAPTVKKLLNSDSADISAETYPEPIDITIIEQFIK